MNWNNFASTLIAGTTILIAIITVCFVGAILGGIFTALTVWGSILGAIAIILCLAIANGMGWISDANGK